MSNAGGFKSLNRYYDMLAGNTVWNPWEPDGAFDALSTITVGATAVASIEFAGIPQTYKHLQLRCHSLKSANPGTLMRVNGNSTVGNYSNHILYGEGSGSALAYTDPNYAGMVWALNDAGTTTIPAIAIIDMLDYASTTKLKTIRSLGGADKNGSGNIYFASGMNTVITSPITSIILNGAGANFNQNSQFTLYGVK
jgi:hypothetical protein